MFNSFTVMKMILRRKPRNSLKLSQKIIKRKRKRRKKPNKLRICNIQLLPSKNQKNQFSFLHENL